MSPNFSRTTRNTDLDRTCSNFEVEPIQETAFDVEDPSDLENSKKLASNEPKTEKSESEMSFLDNWNSISDADKRWNLGTVKNLLDHQRQFRLNCLLIPLAVPRLFPVYAYDSVGILKCCKAI